MNDFYVYGWFNNDWKTYFYVGSGRGSRYKETRKRSKAFSAILSHWDCEPVILLSGLTEKEASAFEMDIKRVFLFEEGYPIVDAEPRTLKREAQRRGIEAAKLEGKYHGRKPLAINTTSFVVLRDSVERGEITNKQAMEQLGVTHATYYRLLYERRNKIGRFAE